MTLVTQAVIFAAQAHDGAARKGGEIPYIVHPMEVVAIASTMTDDPQVLAAAALHDVMEDCGVTFETLSERFGVRVAGDSMEPRFVNGQTVWVKAAQDANNSDIVLCTLNDQGYCKKLRKDENGIALISLNKKYAPIPVQEEDEFRIAGIVVG